MLAGEFLAEHRRIAGKGKARLKINDTVLYQSRDFAIEMLHALRLGGFHGIQQGVVIMLALLDAGAGARIGFQHLERRYPSAAVCLRHEPLTDDVAE